MLVISGLMSLEPFVKVSQKTYLRLVELKKANRAESMDQVINMLLDSRFEASTKTQVSGFLQSRC
jgi:hypothetical protein